MKRYWLSMLFAVLIVAGVGSYYIQAAAHRLPEFVLQRQAGDEQAAAGVTLQGVYGMRELRETVSIDEQGSKYRREQSFVEKLSPDYYSADLKRLIERYPGFMRGKREMSALYEDEKRLVYANIEGKRGEGQRDFRFAVSVMDKNQDRTASYEAAVPNAKAYQQILVHDVQVVEEQLKVVTVNYPSSGRPEPHLYTLGLQSGQAPMDQTLLFEQSNSAGVEISLQGGYPANAVKPSRYAVLYAMLLNKVEQAGRGHQTEEVGGRLLVYDIRSGQEVKIDSHNVSEFLSGGRKGPMQIEPAGDSIYLAKQTDQGIRVLQYDIAEAKLVERSIQMAPGLRFINLKDRRIYMMTGPDKGNLAPPSLVIADITTGGTIYQGTVALKQSGRYPADTLNSLMIHGLAVN